MNVPNLLDDLHRRGVRLRVAGYRLRWRAPVCDRQGDAAAVLGAMGITSGSCRACRALEASGPDRPMAPVPGPDRADIIRVQLGPLSGSTTPRPQGPPPFRLALVMGKETSPEVSLHLCNFCSHRLSCREFLDQTQPSSNLRQVLRRLFGCFGPVAMSEVNAGRTRWRFATMHPAPAIAHSRA